MKFEKGRKFRDNVFVFVYAPNGLLDSPTTHLQEVIGRPKSDRETSDKFIFSSQILHIWDINFYPYRIGVQNSQVK